MPIGNPVTLTSNVASKTISATATASQTLFNVTGGYRINELGVFKNGLRLQDGVDYTARDGLTVTLLSAASGGDKLQFVVFDTFRVAEAIRPNVDEQTIRGNLNVVGILSATSLGGLTNFNLTSGITTFNDVRVGGALTVAGALTFEDVTNIDSVGIITAQSGVSIADSIFHTGDTDTSIRFPSDGTFTVSINGSEITRVNGTGFGILTNSPSQALTLRGEQLIETNSTSADSGNGIYWQSTTSGWNTGQAHAAIFGKRVTANDGYLRFDVRQSGTTSEKLRITAAGDVGIGTEVPETPRGNKGLEVAGTTGAEIVATRFDDNLADGDFIGAFLFKNLDAGGTPNHFAGMYAKANGTAGSMDLHFSSDRAQYEADTSDLVIRSSNVGIGTDNPSRRLQSQANGSTPSALFGNSEHNNSIEVTRTGSTGSYFQVQTYTNICNIVGGPTLTLKTSDPVGSASTERVRIDSAGLVSIPTSGNLQVGGAGSPETDSKVYVANTGGDAYIQVKGADTTGTVGLKFGRNSVANRAGIDWSASTDALSFRTGGTNERVTITSGGFVGINTNNPSRFLHIMGNDGRTGGTPANSDTQLFIDNAGANGTIIEMMSLNDSQSWIMFSDPDAGNQGRIQYDHATDKLHFYTAGAERVRIDLSGNVNITGITTASQLFEGTTRVATSGKAIAMALIFG